MNRYIRPLALAALFFIVAGTATCHFGTEYEISQMSESKMKIKDSSAWVGSEWVKRGAVLQIIGLLLAASAGGIYLFDKKRPRSPMPQDRD